MPKTSHFEIKISDKDYSVTNPEFLLQEKKQKHEEVKQMAWELYKIFLPYDLKVNKKKLRDTKMKVKFCWYRAEEFYNFAKEQESWGVPGTTLEPNTEEKEMEGEE